MLPLSSKFFCGSSVFCHRESRSLHQLKIGKVLMGLKIFLIIKIMLTYVIVHDNCLISYTSSPVCRLIYFYPRVR
jgi:hypothetical protein